jgi:hypothetical protein
VIFTACDGSLEDVCIPTVLAGDASAASYCQLRLLVYSSSAYTDKNENQIFLIYKEIQSGAVAKSYMRKGFLIYVLYEEMRKYFPYMRRLLVIHDFATPPF